MNITFESPFSVSEKDKSYIHSKIEDLNKFEKRISQVNVFLKADDGKKPNGVLAEIRVRVPGNDIFVENIKKDAIVAFSEAYKAVKRQVKKRRDKLNEHWSEVRMISDLVNDNF